jgi:hypothetical protein
MLPWLTASESPFPQRIETDRVSVRLIHEGMPELWGNETDSHQERAQEDRLPIGLCSL